MTGARFDTVLCTSCRMKRYSRTNPTFSQGAQKRRDARMTATKQSFATGCWGSILLKNSAAGSSGNA